MNKIIELQFGSHLYGTNTESSDIDLKGIYLPTAKEIILHNYKKSINTSRKKLQFERNTKDDVDLEILSLDRFLELLIEGQTMALDILFSPDFQKHYLTNEIYKNKDKLLNKNVNAFIGYARMQASKYGIKGSRMDALKRVMHVLYAFSNHKEYVHLIDISDVLDNLVKECSELISLEKTPLVEIVYIKAPNGKTEPHLHVCGRKVPFHATIKYAIQVFDKILDNYGQRAQKAHLAGGVDWKALSHAVRVNSEALELLTTGYITFQRPDKELLLKIKKGEMPYEQVAEIIEKGLADVVAASEISSLRAEPDKEWVNNFIYEVYSEIVKNG